MFCCLETHLRPHRELLSLGLIFQPRGGSLTPLISAPFRPLLAPSFPKLCGERGDRVCLRP